MARFLDALNRKNRGSPPIWIMRQAGRYLPEYRTLREKHSLREMFYNTDLIVEVTKQPIDRFGFDAAIIFSDILLILETFGCKVEFPEKGGPRVHLAQPITNLASQSIESYFEFLGRAIRQVKQTITVPLLGFAGAPFTLAIYMLGEEKIRLWMRDDPEGLHYLLSCLTSKTIEYLLFQQKNGVDAVQLFESASYQLSAFEFDLFAKPYLKLIVDALEKENLGAILFTRNTPLFIKSLVEISPACISLDYTGSLRDMHFEVPSSIAIQGNFSPEMLFKSVEEIRQEVRLILEFMEEDPRWICNLGHGILPKTPLESVYAFIDEVRGYHEARGGIEQRMALGLPPDKNPNLVPLS